MNTICWLREGEEPKGMNVTDAVLLGTILRDTPEESLSLRPGILKEDKFFETYMETVTTDIISILRCTQINKLLAQGKFMYWRKAKILLNCHHIDGQALKYLTQISKVEQKTYGTEFCFDLLRSE